MCDFKLNRVSVKTHFRDAIEVPEFNLKALAELIAKDPRMIYIAKRKYKAVTAENRESCRLIFKLLGMEGTISMFRTKKVNIFGCASERDGNVMVKKLVDILEEYGYPSKKQPKVEVFKQECVVDIGTLGCSLEFIYAHFDIRNRVVAGKGWSIKLKYFNLDSKIPRLSFNFRGRDVDGRVFEQYFSLLRNGHLNFSFVKRCTRVVVERVKKLLSEIAASAPAAVFTFVDPAAAAALDSAQPFALFNQALDSAKSLGNGNLGQDQEEQMMEAARVLVQVSAQAKATIRPLHCTLRDLFYGDESRAGVGGCFVSPTLSRLLN